MPNPIAEAFVRVRADTTGFQQDLAKQVQSHVSQVPAGQLQLPVANAGAAQAAAAGVVTANQQIAASVAQVTQTTAAEATALANVQQAQVALERATTNLARVKVAANTTSREIAQAETLEAAAANRLTAANIRLGEVTAARVGVADGLAAVNQRVAASSAVITATSAAEAAASAAVGLAKRGLIDATEALAAVQSNAGASAADLAKAQLAVVVADDRLTAANIRLIESQAGVNNSFLASKNLSRTGVQPLLVGFGQGALSSRIAFFSATGAGVAALAGGFLKATSVAADFEQSMNTLQVVARATDAEMRAVSETATQLGADITLPAVSATDAAEAMTQLARSGLKIQDAMEGARGVLQLAAAAQTDNATAAIVTARALNAFNLAGTEATHVADLLTGAAIAGGQSIQETAVALQQSAAAAAAVNVPLEDTATALALLARNGLVGSDAGTSLRTTLLRLNPTTKEARQLADALGVSIFNARGKFVGLPRAVESYRKALRGLTQEQQQAILQTIFGQDAYRAINILISEGAAGFDNAAKKTTEQGIAAEVAAARTSGLKGQVSALQSNMETLALEIGNVGIPVLTDFVETLNAVAGAALKAAEGLAKIGEIKLPGTDISLAEFLGDFALIGNPSKEIDLTRKGIRGFIDDVKGLKNIELRLPWLPEETQKLLKFFAIAKQASDLQKQPVREAPEGPVGPIGRVGPSPLETNLNEIRANLTASLRVLSALGEDAAGDIGKPFREQVDVALAELRRLGPEGAAILQDLGPRLANILGPELRAAFSDFTGLDLSIDQTKVPKQITDMIDNLVATGPAGVARLRRLGKDLQEALADGIEDNAESVERARQSLIEVTAAAEQAVTDAVNSAKRNLISIGSELGQLISQAIDAGPAGRAIKATQDRLDRMRRGSSLSGLKFNKREADRDLAAAKASIFTVGKPTAGQQQAIDAFLDPFKQKVLDAQSEIDQFSVEGVLTNQQKAADALKTSVTQGINDIIVKYNNGAIKLGALQKGIAALIKRAGLKHYEDAGKFLGEAFADKFNATIAGLITQATNLDKGPKRPGSGQAPTQVDVIRAAAEASARVEAARVALQTEQKNLQKEQKNAQLAANRILREIRNRLPKPPPTKKQPPGRHDTKDDVTGVNP